MKKSFGLYAIGWLAALGLFNVITFVTPNEIHGVSKFDGLFWVAYALITIVFIGQLVCAYFAFRADSLRKTFYNISLIRVSLSALIAILVVGGLCMAVIQIPTWVGIIACCILLAVNIIAIVRTAAAIQAVSDVDTKVKSKTLFIKLLTAQAQALMARAGDEPLQETARTVYEAIRYSDPMSDPALAAVEDKISCAFRDFSAAVETGSAEVAQASSKTLLALIGERNATCKILK